MLRTFRQFFKNNKKVRFFVGHILPATGLFDRVFRNWKVDDFWRERIDLAVSSPDNENIPRCPGAGIIKNGKQLMHNGIWVNVGSYYGPEISRLLAENQGVHEPQEEYIFQKVLDYIKTKNSSKKVMVELGSFWAFYSLWFKRTFPQARAIMVEPEEYNIHSGKRNFALNLFEGTFINAFVGDNHEPERAGTVRAVSVDGIAKEFNLEHIDILHSDIQGFEEAMLSGAENVLSNQSAEFLFVSTHTNDLHYACLDTIKSYGYKIICDVDLNDTYFEDGLIVACSEGSAFKFSGNISKRSEVSKYASIG
jgi:hypothetical protein